MKTIDEMEHSCTYQSNNICAASLWSLGTDENKKTQYCNSDKHDSCSLFLAKSLRTHSEEYHLQKVYFAHV